MFGGLGAVELLIVIAVAVALFGAPALVAFWLGYRAGIKRGTPESEEGEHAPPAAEIPVEGPGEEKRS